MTPAEYNPFGPPLSAEPPGTGTVPRQAAALESVEQRMALLAVFRSETHALAALVLFGGILGFAGLVVLKPDPGSWSAIMTLSFSTGQTVLGIQVIRKKIAAIKILMATTYLLLIALCILLFAPAGSSIPFLPLLNCIAAVGLVAAQIHRVLRNARRLNSAGIPLSARPDSLSPPAG